MKDISVIGLDLAKDVFQIHAADHRGKKILNKKLRRSEVREFFVQLPKCLVGMEACAGSQFWSRTLQALGHEVRIIAPQFVRPYVKSNKNDAADAEAIAEAVTRPSMRFVSTKATWQQEIQFLHRARTRIVRDRVALANELRGFLYELGIIAPKGHASLRKKVLFLLAEEGTSFSDQYRLLLQDLLDELDRVNERIARYEGWILQVARQSDACLRLQKIEGIGLITATALIAAAGNAADFKNGRQFSAWIGLVPKQYSSGGKSNLLGISKRGDAYLRSLLIHGARAVATHAKKRSDPRSAWLNDKIKTRGFNRGIVAFANKNARIAWVILRRGEEYRSNNTAAAA